MESLNLSSVWNLPCIFVAENNGYAEATSSKWSVSCENIADRAAAFGMPGVVVDGHDFFAVYEVAGEAIKRAREGGGPTLVECKINRYYGHFEGDAQTYRSIDEVKNVKENKDCPMLFAKRVTEQGLLTQAQLDAIDKEVAAEIDASVVHAEVISEADRSRPIDRCVRQLSLIDSLITRGDKDGQNAYIQAVHQRGIGPGDGA